MVSQVQSEIGLAFSDKKRCYWTSLKQFFAHFSTVFNSLIGMHVMQKILSTVFADSYSKVRELVQV